MKYFLLVLLGLVWSLRIAAIKNIAESGVDADITFQLGLIGIAVMMLAALVVRRERIELSRRTLPFFLLSGLFGMVLPFLTEVTVAPNLPVFIFIVVITTMPIWTLLIVGATGSEKVTRLQSAGVMLGFAAVLMIVFDSIAIEIDGSLIWIAAAFIVPLCYASNTVFVASRWPSGVSPVAVAAGQSALAALMVIMVSPVSGMWSELPTDAATLAKLAAIIGLEGAGLFIYLAIARSKGANFVAFANYLSMAFGAVWGAIIFGDRIGLLTLLAALLLVAALTVSRQRW